MFDYEYWGHGEAKISDNMALEEYLLKRSEEKRVATIRFWDVGSDAVVLGYGEAASALKRRDSSFEVARRITGGSHVQFDRNCLAYSFTVPRDGSFRHFDDMRKYYAEKVAAALTELGIEVSKVDNRASTINVGGRVVASHAMFWGVKSALMHGLMIIERYDVDKIMGRVVLRDRQIGRGVYREYDALKGIPALRPLLSIPGAIDRGGRTDYAKNLIANGVLEAIAGDRYRKEGVNEKVTADARRLLGVQHVGDPWFEERDPPITNEVAEAIPGEELSGKLKKGLGYCMYSEVGDKDFKDMAEPA